MRLAKLIVWTTILSIATACAVVTTPTTNPLPSQHRSAVVLALAQEPDTLNPYLASQRAAGEVHTFIIEGLLGVDESGAFYPILASEVPTAANGGVSPDGLTITYHLRKGIVWSDGTPFTCSDVQFTWQAAVHPKSGAVSTSGYSDIKAVDCPDPHTAVAHYRTFYAAFLVPFWAILPKHATGDPGEMTHWDYNRAPLGTGPYKITEWSSGDHIALVRNPYYRDTGRPAIDSVIIRFVPSREVALQLLETAQVTLVGDLAESDLRNLAERGGISVAKSPSSRSERLLLNLADPNIDTPDDPSRQPHPILGDPRVRQALELAIDKKTIVNGLLDGQALVGTNELNVGWAHCETAPSPFNPTAAKQLLEQAGWVTDAQGIRVARGARYARDGTRLHLRLQGPSGDPLRDHVEQFIAEEWKSVGVEVVIENAPTAVIFGTWDSGSLARHGKFDVLIYTTGPYVDPQSQVETYFSSWNIPLSTNRGAGYNYSRWINNGADQAIRDAGSASDVSTRQKAYCRLMEEINNDRPQIYLYARNVLAAARSELKNWKINVWKNLGWNSAEWQLE